MKNLKYSLLFIAFIINILACKKEQITGDDACPNCPVITNISPSLAQPGEIVSIVGKNFGTDKAKISLEILTEPKITIQPIDIKEVTAELIKFIVPANGTGKGKVVVKLNVGADILASDDAGILNPSENQTFEFKSLANFTSPTISGKVGDELLISGLNFGTKKEDVELKIGNSAPIPVSAVTNNEIKFILPKTVITNGIITAKINGFSVGGTLNFEYLKPQITSTNLAGARDQEIVLSGNHFGINKTEIKVLIGQKEIPAANILEVKNSEIKIKVPLKIGSGPLSVFAFGVKAGQEPNFTYNLSYVVSTYNYTIPLNVINTKGRKNANNLIDGVIDFRVDTTSGADVIYIGFQRFFGNSSVFKISSGNQLVPPTIAAYNLDILKLKATGNQLPALRWAMPVQNKLFLHYLNVFIGLNAPNNETHINEIPPSPSTVISAPFVEKFNQYIEFNKVTAANLNQFYTTEYNSTSRLTNIYSLTRPNTTNARFSYSSVLNNIDISPESDIEFNNDNLFIADLKTHKLKKLNLSNNSIIDFAGSIKGYQDGPTSNAKFSNPKDVAIDKLGNIYVCDADNGLIRLIKNNTVTTIAGVPNKSSPIINGDGKLATFNNPTYMAIGKGNVIYVYDKGNAQATEISLIRVIRPE
jgi:hypothetical protein